MLDSGMNTSYGHTVANGDTWAYYVTIIAGGSGTSNTLTLTSIVPVVLTLNVVRGAHTDTLTWNQIPGADPTVFGSYLWGEGYPTPITSFNVVNPPGLTMVLDYSPGAPPSPIGYQIEVGFGPPFAGLLSNIVQF